MTLYAASVPVFRRYLAQARGMLAKGNAGAQIGDAFPAGQQFATAAGFALRIAFPLAGQAIPALPDDAGVYGRLRAAESALQGLAAADFEAAEHRVIQHRAGFAELEQSGADFLYLYGLPNFFFHLTMGYASLRATSADLGKADFDGFHKYPAGFRFG